MMTKFCCLEFLSMSLPCSCALMYFFPKRLSIKSSITRGALVFLPVNKMPIDEPVDNETDVAVEAESLEHELEEDNDDESVELAVDDDEDDMSTRESHSILIGGTSVLKSSKRREFCFVHFCWCRRNSQELYHAVLRGKLRTKKICMRRLVYKPNTKGPP